MGKRLIRRGRFFSVVLGGLWLTAFAASLQAQFPSGDYLNSFEVGGNTNDFTGTGSVASWIYWYDLYDNVSITNDIHMDVNGDTNSGSLRLDIPFGSTGNQQLFFGTFGNSGQYDFSYVVNLLNFDKIEFDIRFQSGTPLSPTGDFGTIGVGIIHSSYSYQQFGRLTIPATEVDRIHREGSHGTVHNCDNCGAILVPAQ